MQAQPLAKVLHGRNTSIPGLHNQETQEKRLLTPDCIILSAKTSVEMSKFTVTNTTIQLASQLILFNESKT